jgi:hypothetical protein
MKDQFNNEKFSLDLQEQHKKSEWYVHHNYSKHMTGDKNMFLTLKNEQDGSVSFRNDDLSKIIGRATIKLESKDAKAENVVLVEDMKNNLLSVGQMCDEGNKLLFESEKCEIIKEGSGKLVATARRTSNNICVLNEIGRGKGCLGKENES